MLYTNAIYSGCLSTHSIIPLQIGTSDYKIIKLYSKSNKIYDNRD